MPQAICPTRGMRSRFGKGWKPGGIGCLFSTSHPIRYAGEELSAANLTVDELAIQIGMNPSTFYRKTKNGLDAFTVGEMHSLVDALKLSGKEAKDIFLS